jgi:protein TonB
MLFADARPVRFRKQPVRTGEELMFEQTFVAAGADARKPFTFAASLALQTAALSLVLVIPLVHPEVLRPIALTPPLVFLPIREVLPPVEARPAPAPVSRTPSPVRTVFTGPTAVPRRIVYTDAPEFPRGDTVTGISGAAIATLIGALPAEQPPAVPVHATPQPAPVPAAGPTRVSEGVQGARLIFGPKPPYPTLARAARVQGAVRIEAIIGTDGAVRNVRLVSGPPLLAKAALDAVSQWRYRPTMLGGNAVEVLTEITVNFTLAN